MCKMCGGRIKKKTHPVESSKKQSVSFYANLLIRCDQMWDAKSLLISYNGEAEARAPTASPAVFLSDINRERYRLRCWFIQRKI